jgi:hypothetical protein
VASSGIFRRPSFNIKTIVVLLLMAVATGIYVIFFSHAAPNGPTANLWVVPSGSGTCSPAHPAVDYSTALSSNSVCSLAQNAQVFQLAASRADSSQADIIRVKPGSYGSQTVTETKSSPGISIIGEDKPTTTLSSLGIGLSKNDITGAIGGKNGAWIKFQDIKITGTVGFEDVGGGFPHDINLQNVDAVGGGFWDGGKNITWKGGRIGPGWWACNPSGTSNCHGDGWVVLQGSPDPLDNITFDGLTFDSIKIDPTCLLPIHPGNDPCHVEVIRLDDGASNITIKNSIFTNNIPNTAQIFTGSRGGLSSVNGLVLENNFFGDATNAGLTAGSGCRNLKIRYNTWKSTMNLGGCTSASTSVIVTGNLGNGSCSPGGGTITYSNNVWGNVGACGNSDLGNQTITYASDGIHLTSSSINAIDKGGTSCSATTPSDIDGDTRPQGLACDAGADEFTTGGSNPPPPPPPPTCNRAADVNCDGSVNILDVTVVLSNFGKPVAQSSDPRADTSGNGSVDIPDLTVVLSAFGT